MREFLLVAILSCLLGTGLKATNSAPVTSVDSLFQVGLELCDEAGDFVAAKAPISLALSLVDSVLAPVKYLDILDKFVKCNYRLHQSEEATRLALTGYELATQLELPLQRIRFIQWLGRVVEVEYQWEEALRFYGRVLELAEEVDDLQVLYDAQLNLAVTYYKSGEVTTGLLRMEECEALVRQMGSPAHLVADNQLWLGIMHRSQGELERALFLYQSALPVFDSTGVLYRQTHVRMELAQTYLDLGAAAKTIAYVEEAFSIAGEKVTSYEKMYGNDLLYRANRYLKQYDEAFTHMEAWYETKLALKDESDSRALQELTRSYELNEQRGIIKDQQKELDFARYSSILWLLVVCLFALLCGVLALFLFRFRSLNNELRSALEYQEVLRGEVYHRVSNNLQLIISLLDLHQTQSHTQKNLQLLQDISGKVFTIASVHQLLYKSDGEVVSNIKDYLHNLAEHWGALWEIGQHPNFVFDIPDHQFNQDTLVPLGMMLNELVVNTRKYAGGAGNTQVTISIKIKAEQNDHFVIEYRDDGPGFPDEEMSMEAGNLGFHILKSMSRQLNGSVSIRNDQGAVTTIDFRMKNSPSATLEKGASRQNLQDLLSGA